MAVRKRRRGNESNRNPGAKTNRNRNSRGHTDLLLLFCQPDRQPPLLPTPRGPRRHPSRQGTRDQWKWTPQLCTRQQQQQRLPAHMPFCHHRRTWTTRQLTLTTLPTMPPPPPPLLPTMLLLRCQLPCRPFSLKLFCRGDHLRSARWHVLFCHVVFFWTDLFCCRLKRWPTSIRG